MKENKDIVEALRCVKVELGKHRLGESQMVDAAILNLIRASVPGIVRAVLAGAFQEKSAIPEMDWKVLSPSPLRSYQMAYDSTYGAGRSEVAAHENAVGQVFIQGVDFARSARNDLLRELLDEVQSCRWEDAEARIKKALEEPGVL